MDDAHDGSYAREPQLDDLVRLARALNAHHVLYVLIGWSDVIAHGGALVREGFLLTDYFLRPEAQFKTTVMGAVFSAVLTGRGIRNRLPSGETENDA